MHHRALLLVAALIGAGICLAHAQDVTAPVIQSVTPVAGGTVSNLASVTVTFSEAVSTVEAEDFLINGTPAGSRSGAGNVWTFRFSQPPAGLVQFGWDASHAIYDTYANRFDQSAAGATWAVSLADTIAPAVQWVTPVPGAVVAALTSLEVHFSEPVTGVEPGDLQVNGVGAAAVSGSGAGPYVFAFAQPPGGTVTFSWAGGHGIADTAPAPNPFAGAPWTCTLTPGLVADIVINEILAENLNGLVDTDTDTSDWIELHNRGGTSVNLAGWSITDDPAQPGQWVFTNVTLGAGQYLIVFASGKDRRSATGTNHLNFTLAASEYLGLYNAQFPRQAVHEFAPAYPEQRGDVPWGRTSSNTFTYFAAPTPLAANASATNYTGFASVPHASVASGLFAQAFTVSLASDTPGAALYYTTNGDAPSLSNGVLYTGPLAITGTADRAVFTLRAIATRAGLLPSLPLTRTYVFPDLVLSQPAQPTGYPTQWITGRGMASTSGDYQMDPQVLTNGTNLAIARQGLGELPVLSIVAGVQTLFAPSNGVYTARLKQGNQRQANAEMWLPDGRRVFQADCGIEIQGGTSPSDSGGDWKDKKLSVRLVFKGDFGTPRLRARVFEDSPVEEFNTLLADGGLNYWWVHMGDATQRERAKFLTDQFCSDLMNRAGLVAQHGRYVHFYLNGLYWGLYNLHERMDEAAAESYLGGAKEEYDVLKHTGTAAVNGNLAAYNAMLAVARSGLANNAVYEQLQAHLDVPWFTDYMLVNFWVGNDDWPHHNWYAWRRRTPGSLPWRFVSWDAEHCVKAPNANPLANGNLTGSGHCGELFRLLTNNVEYRLHFADRVHALSFNDGPLHTLPDAAAHWSPASPSDNIPAGVYRRRVDAIWNSIVCESARWGDVATANANNPYTRDTHYARELNGLYSLTNVGGTPNYFPLRGSNVLAHYRNAGLYPAVAAPRFSRHGGNVPAGFALHITNLAAGSTVYFTTNGADPRVYGAGTVSPQAIAYAGVPLTLGQSRIVKARARNGSAWSALNEAAFTVGAPGVPLRLTEIMYHPPGGEPYEYLELLNLGVTPLHLGGGSFEGIAFVFPPGFVLPAGARIVLANDTLPAAFAARYPGVQVAGWFAGSLDNGGERIALRDGAGNTVFSVDYDDAEPWPVAADGGGYSLEILDANGDPDDPANWRAASVLQGTPGQPPGALPAALVVINEILALNLATTNHAGAHPDYVELRNASGVPVDLTGWSLTDNGNPRRFVFTNGPTLAAGAFLLLWCDTNHPAPGLHTGFGLDREGGGVFLYDANTNRVDACGFGRQIADRSLNRINLTGAVWDARTPTPGYPNDPVPPVQGSGLLINEWLANAPPGQSDWIELHSPLSPRELDGISIAVNDTVFRYPALSCVEGGGFIRLFADEQPGPGHLDFKLPAGGATLVLYSAEGTELDRVTYGPQTEGVSQGRLPDGSPNIATFLGSASPGAGNYLLSNSGAVLNEILARNFSGDFSPWGERADWIEIANTNGSSVSLAGLGLGDTPDAPRWIVPAGVSLAGQTQLRLWCDGAQPASTASGADLNTGFPLSAESGGVYLFATNGQVMDYVEYGAQIAGLSIGRSSGAWRLLASPTPGAVNAAAAALGSPAGLRFNEWLSNPSHGPDWFELFNTNATPVDLGGLYLTDDPSLSGLTRFPIAPLTFAGPRGFVRFLADGDPSQGRDHVNFNLDPLGETLLLHGPDLALLDSANLGPLAAGVSQGSLPDGSDTLVTFPDTATPAAANYLPAPSVVINEILARPGAAMEDAIELYNPTAQAAPLGGWCLSDSVSDLKKFRIPDGTLLAGGAYLVFYATQFNHGGPGSFALDGARGGSVYLSEADAAGNLTGFRAQAAFGAAEPGVSLGRWVACQGARFTALAGPSFGQDNAPSLDQFRAGAGLPNREARLGPLVLNEIHYHPAGAGDSADEFIEVANMTAGAVTLHEPAAPAGRWTLRGGVEFLFPTNLTLAPGGLALIVGFDPVAEPAAETSFRGRFGVPAGVPVLGPWQGTLANAGEALELTRPVQPVQWPEPGPGHVPQILADRVEYADTSPWPTNADGGGASLQRLAPAGFGDDPTQWIAAAPTAGGASPSLPATAPVIIEHPVGRVAAPNSRAVFSVSACGPGPLSYQWKKNGTNIDAATNASWILASAQAADAGAYSVVVSNATGRATGGPAVLAFGPAPAIVTQPAGTNVVPGAPFVLTVGVTGAAPLAYQWRFNGLPLAGATNPVYSVASARPADAGSYSVLVGNGVGVALSATAEVLLVVAPTFSEQPTNVFLRVPPDPLAVSTRVAVFRVNATTINPPLAFRWRFHGLPIDPAAPGITGVTSNILTITNVQFSHGGDYDCVLTDNAGQFLSATARLIPIITPIVIQASANTMTNSVSSTVTLSAGIFGSPPPFTFIWRSNSAILRAFTTPQTNDFMTFATPAVPATVNYRVEVTNYSTLVINYSNRIYFTNYIVADSDADGLPDYYETTFGGGAMNPGDDDDGDGLGNLAEYLAGTDPTDPESYLRLDSIASGPGATLTFGAVANRTYTIQHAPGPAGGPWSNLVHVIALPTNRVVTLFDPTATTQRFYRAVTPRQ